MAGASLRPLRLEPEGRDGQMQQLIEVDEDEDADHAGSAFSAHSSSLQQPAQILYRRARTLLPSGLALFIVIFVVLALHRLAGVPPFQRPWHRAMLGSAIEKDVDPCSMGESCLKAVDWAMRHGIYEMPENYVGLSPTSPFSDFQHKLHKKGLAECPEPCIESQMRRPALHTASSTGQPPTEEPHELSDEGLEEDGDYDFDTEDGDYDLDEDGEDDDEDYIEFVDRQDVVEAAAKKPQIAAVDEASVGEQEIAKLPEAQDDEEKCETVTGNHPCYAAVVWAMSTGIREHPEWYEGTGLHKNSEFKEGQLALHKLGKGDCPRPCMQDATTSTMDEAAEQASWFGDAEAPSLRIKPLTQAELAVSTLTSTTTTASRSTHTTTWITRPLGKESIPTEIQFVHGDERGLNVVQVHDDKPKIPANLPCKNAKKSDRCFVAVLWAMKTGIHEQPEWYKGLAPYSSFHAFQAALWEQGTADCHKPCGSGDEGAEKPLANSMYCFSFLDLNSSEMPLVKLQLDQKVGIFACDSFVVASSEKVPLGKIGDESFSTIAVDVRNKDSWHNSELFAGTWQVLLQQREMWQHDWIVKADPDCVWFPDRLRQHISTYAVPRLEQYFTNCNVPAGSSNLYGALEVFSKAAIKAYNASWQQCQVSTDWKDLGEDLYMQRCMDIMGVAKVGEFTLVGDARCNFAPCASSDRVAFHPFKDVSAFMTCLQQARQNLQGPKLGTRAPAAPS